MKKPLLWAMVMVALSGPPFAGAQNLIPNADHTAADPMEGFQIDFSHQGAHEENASFIKFGELGGRPCPVSTCDDKYMGLKGMKILSPLAEVKNGETYKASYEAYKEYPYTGFKAWAEVYAVDPRPNPTMVRTQTNQIPAVPGKHPALVLCYRKYFEGTKVKAGEWTEDSVTFTIPEKDKLKVLGQPATVGYACIKVMGLGAGLDKEKIHIFGVSKFQLKKL